MPERGSESFGPRSRARDELGLEDMLRDLVLESIVDGLALIERARSAGAFVLGWLPCGSFGRGDARRTWWTPSRLRSAVFDLTLLGVESARDGARIARRYADYFACRPAELAPEPERATVAEAHPTELVAIARDPADGRLRGRFRLSNETDRSGTVAFPRVLSFASAQFTGPVLLMPSFEPAVIRLEPGGEARVAITIDDTAGRLREGRSYTANGTVALSGGPELAVVFEVRP